MDIFSGKESILAGPAFMFKMSEIVFANSFIKIHN